MSWMIPRANIILIAFQSSKVWPTRSQLFTNFSSQSWCWLFRLFMASGNTYESTIPYRPLNILTTRQTHNPSHTVRNARRMWSQSEYPIGQNKQLRVLCCCSYCGMFAQHLVTKISIYIYLYVCVCIQLEGEQACSFSLVIPFHISDKCTARQPINRCSGGYLALPHSNGLPSRGRQGDKMCEVWPLHKKN